MSGLRDLDIVWHIKKNEIALVHRVKGEPEVWLELEGGHHCYGLGVLVSHNVVRIGNLGPVTPDAGESK